MPITLQNNQIVFPNGSTQNNAPTGVIGTSQSYVKLPSGLVLMFGYQETLGVTGGRINYTYPNVFTEVFQVQLQGAGIDGTDTGGTLNGATVRGTTSNTSGFGYSMMSGVNGFFWLTVGRG